MLHIRFFVRAKIMFLIYCEIMTKVMEKILQQICIINDKKYAYNFHHQSSSNLTNKINTVVDVCFKIIEIF